MSSIDGSCISDLRVAGISVIYNSPIGHLSQE